MPTTCLGCMYWLKMGPTDIKTISSYILTALRIDERIQFIIIWLQSHPLCLEIDECISFANYLTRTRTLNDYRWKRSCCFDGWQRLCHSSSCCGQGQCVCEEEAKTHALEEKRQTHECLLRTSVGSLYTYLNPGVKGLQNLRYVPHITQVARSLSVEFKYTWVMPHYCVESFYGFDASLPRGESLPLLRIRVDPGYRSCYCGINPSK